MSWLSAIGKNARRGIGMGAAGGVLGYMNSGDLGGAIGGAAAGAAFGAVGMPMGRRFLAKRGGVAGLMGTGLNKAIGGADWGLGKLAGNRMGRRALNRFLPYSRRESIAGGLMRAESFIGRNAAATNKYGGAALAALGMGSAAHIGSSIMSSNRGY